MSTQRDLKPTHEIYGYIDANNEPMTMTDTEPCRIYDDELYTPTGEIVGVCRKTDGAGGKRWVMPNHDTTLLLRKLPDRAA